MKDHKSLKSSTKSIDIKTWYFFQLFDTHKYLQNPNQFTSLYDTYADVKQCGYNYQTIQILIFLSNDTDTDIYVKRYWYWYWYWYSCQTILIRYWYSCRMILIWYWYSFERYWYDTDTAVEWYWYETETYFLENLTTLIYIYILCFNIYIRLIIINNY